MTTISGLLKRHGLNPRVAAYPGPVAPAEAWQCRICFNIQASAGPCDCCGQDGFLGRPEPQIVPSGVRSAFTGLEVCQLTLDGIDPQRIRDGLLYPSRWYAQHPERYDATMQRHHGRKG